MQDSFKYAIRDKNSGKFYSSYGSWSTNGNRKEFKTEKAALKLIDDIIREECGMRWYTRSSRKEVKDISKSFRFDLELIRIKIVHSIDSVESLRARTKNAMISRHMYDKYSTAMGDFWDSVTARGYADEIKYIMRLQTDPSTDWNKLIINAREQVRNLGIKTRTFKECNGMFGFLNKDQALKARLTITASDFIDMEAIREELFG